MYKLSFIQNRTKMKMSYSNLYLEQIIFLIIPNIAFQLHIWSQQMLFNL